MADSLNPSDNSQELDIKIVIENESGTYKSFETEGDPDWESYPLKGVTYPVKYGYIEGYIGEDDAELDVFVGSGTQYGWMEVWRVDTPVETKMFINVSPEELEAILAEFRPVLIGHTMCDKEGFFSKLETFKDAV